MLRIEAAIQRAPAGRRTWVSAALPDKLCSSRVLEAPTAVPVSAAAIDVASRDEVEQFILKALCEQSGYPPEIITLDADLEADLGIDTVKQAQVLGKVRDKFDLRTEEKLSLRDFMTCTPYTSSQAPFWSAPAMPMIASSI